MTRLFSPRWRFGLVLVLLGCLAADWPQLLGPTRNGICTEKDLLDTFPKKGPAVVWQLDVGEGFSSPAIAGDRLILFHRISDEDVVECLVASSGKRLWKHSYRTDYEDDYGKGNGPRSTPVIARDKVYTLGAGGQLLCLDLKSGKPAWEKELLALYGVKKNFFGVGTTPLIEGDLLLVNVGGTGAGIVAFHKDTGKEVWKATDDGASYSSPIAATIERDRLAFFFTREGLVALRLADGEVRFRKRWRSRNPNSVNAAMPVLLEGKCLFLSSSYDTGDVLLEIGKDSAREVWKSKETLSSHFSTPVAVGEQLYGFEGRQEGGAQLRCIDWKTGKVRWTEPGFGCGSIIAAGSKLFVLSEGGDLVLVEASGDKYQEKARAAILGQPCRAHLALSNGLLYARDRRKLVCWKVKK
jgi:outer membrane protein assembly factor BamB